MKNLKTYTNFKGLSKESKLFEAITDGLIPDMRSIISSSSINDEGKYDIKINGYKNRDYFISIRFKTIDPIDVVNLREIEEAVDQLLSLFNGKYNVINAIGYTVDGRNSQNSHIEDSNFNEIVIFIK